MKIFLNEMVKIERITVNFALILNILEIDVTFKVFFSVLHDEKQNSSEYEDGRTTTNQHRGRNSRRGDRSQSWSGWVALSVFLFFFFVFRVSSLSCKVYVCIWHSVHKVLRLFAGKWETNRYFTHTLGWIDTAAGGWRTDVSDKIFNMTFLMICFSVKQYKFACKSLTSIRHLTTG